MYSETHLPLITSTGKIPWTLPLKLAATLSPKKAAFTAILGIVGAVSSLLVPHMVGIAVDSMAAGSMKGAIKAAHILAVVMVFGAILSYLQRKLSAELGEILEHKLRMWGFEMAVKATEETATPPDRGSVVNRLTTDVASVRGAAVAAFTYGVNTAVVAVGALAVLTYMHPALSLAVLLTLPAAAPLTRLLGAAVQKAHSRYQQKLDQLTSLLTQHLDSLDQAIVQGAAELETRKLVEEAKKVKTSGIKMARLNSCFGPAVQMVAGGCHAAVLGVGAWLAITGKISVGVFVAASIYAARLVWPSVAVGWLAGLLARAAKSLERIAALSGLSESRKKKERNKDEVEAITVQGVRLLSEETEDSGNPAGSQLDLALKKGKAIAVVGPDCKGCDELLLFMAGILKPQHGRIAALDKDGKEREVVFGDGVACIMGQQEMPLPLSIRENLLLAAAESSRHEKSDLLASALSAAGLTEENLLPELLKRSVASSGAMLSEGERQRLVLAMALASGTPFILSEHALCHVDLKTKRKILERTTKELNRGFLLATTSASTALLAENVTVLVEGEPVEQGNTTELITKGTYLPSMAKLEE